LASFWVGAAERGRATSSARRVRRLFMLRESGSTIALTILADAVPVNLTLPNLLKEVIRIGHAEAVKGRREVLNPVGRNKTRIV
jgi:hypothetical protein